MRWWYVKWRKRVQKTCKGIIRNEKLLNPCGDFEKKELEEEGCLRRSKEKSNTHLSLHFSFKGSLFNGRRALR